jgi:hypothetical protein
MKNFSTRRNDPNHIAAGVTEIYYRAKLIRAQSAEFVARARV